MTRGYASRGALDGRLLCDCWCGATSLWVRVEDVRAGRTGSCGPGCNERSPLPAKGVREGTGDAATPTLRGEPAPVPESSDPPGRTYVPGRMGRHPEGVVATSAPRLPNPHTPEYQSGAQEL